MRVVVASFEAHIIQDFPLPLAKQSRESVDDSIADLKQNCSARQSISTLAMAGDSALFNSP